MVSRKQTALEETPFAPRRLFFPGPVANGRTSDVPLVVPIVLVVFVGTAPGEMPDAVGEHRIVIEAARISPDEVVDILVIDGRIESIGKVDRRDRDVLVRAQGGQVIAGRRRRFTRIPDWSELVGGPADGLTSVVLPLDVAAREWLAGVRGRAAWIGPRLAGDTDPNPRLEPGFAAELLVLDPISGALSQVVVGDEVLRRADLETRREMIANARRGMASLPGPEPGMRGLRLDAAGLATGRVDLSSDGQVIHERTVAPHRSDRRWEIRPDASGWVVTLGEPSGLLATIRLQGSRVTAEVPSGEQVRVEGAEGPPSIDLAATAASQSAALVRLPDGGALERPVVELALTAEGLSVTPGRLRFRAVPRGQFPLPLFRGEKGFEMTSDSGRRGLFVLGSDHFPVRCWETTRAGDVEWVERPLGGKTPPGPQPNPPETVRGST